MTEVTNYGIWIGKNATIAITDKLQISFLRLQKDKIVSILKQKDEGIIGIVYGYGIKPNAKCEICYKGLNNQNLIDLHSKDNILCDSKTLTYTMYDGTQFNCVLAEKIVLTDNFDSPKINPGLSVSKRLELWNLGAYYRYTIESISAGIDTHKYSICFNLSSNGDKIYCRVGQNGYCEKGRAMLSTVCLRPNEVRMIGDNLNSLKEYKPMLECFVSDSCSFPADRGWYWSLKEATDDYITLHGCGGAIYRSNRIRKGIYEMIE